MALFTPLSTSLFALLPTLSFTFLLCTPLSPQKKIITAKKITFSRYTTKAGPLPLLSSTPRTATGPTTQSDDTTNANDFDIDHIVAKTSRWRLGRRSIFPLLFWRI